MKLKLTHIEFKALYALFELVLETAEPSAMGMQSKMLHSILSNVYEKLYKKAFRRKDKYAIELSTHEAIAFWFFFQKYQLPADMVFETNLLHTITNSIHQKFI